MDYAVIETGKKQHKVNIGQQIIVDELKKKPEETHVFDKVLLFVRNGKIELGTPYVKDMIVSGKVIQNMKSEKIKVAKFKAKSRYRRKYGARKNLSKVLIEKIEGK